MKRLILCGAAVPACAAAVWGAPITWQPAVDTIGKSQLVEGTVVYAVSGGVGATITGGGAGGAQEYSFAGVDYTDLVFTGAPTSRITTDVSEGAASTGDADFDTIIQSFADSESGITSGTQTISGLQPGTFYQIQVFYNDQRSFGVGRVMTYGDAEDPENSVGVAGDAGDWGQHAVGSFVADSTTQDLTHTTSGFGNVHFNAMLVVRQPSEIWFSGVLDLSGRDTTGLGEGESDGFFASPKTFDASTDLSLDDIPWSSGGLSGSFDLSLVGTSSMAGIRRGGKGAWGTADSATGSALIDPGESITIDSLAVSDLKGDLAGRAVTGLKIVAVYLGNKTTGDGASINGIIADGAAGGDTNGAMRNGIVPSPSATILGAGTLASDGFSVNGIEISMEVGNPSEVEVVGAVYVPGTGFQVSFTGLDPATTYELRRSDDLSGPFTPVAGTARMPGGATDSYTDAAAPLPGPAFYQLWRIP